MSSVRPGLSPVVRRAALLATVLLVVAGCAVPGRMSASGAAAPAHLVQQDPAEHPAAAQAPAAVTTATTAQTASGSAGRIVSSAPAPVLAQAPAATTRPAALSGSLYVDPSSSAAQWIAAHPSDSRAATIKSRISTVPTARWFLQPSDAQWVANYVASATVAGKTALLVAYYLPLRDCGSYSAGGATDSSSYISWITTFASGIGSAAAVVLLEPDSLFYTSCLTSAQLTTRLSLLNQAISILAAKAPNAVVYLDGGSPVHGTTAAQMAALLVKAGVTKTRGFAVDINNFSVNNTAYDYGIAIRNAVKSSTGTYPSFLLDTSRNGAAIDPTLWCNPATARLGMVPQWFYGTDYLDGVVWFKHPGESDGACGNATSSTSGQFVPDIAVALAG